MRPPSYVKECIIGLCVLAADCRLIYAIGRIALFILVGV